MNNLVYIHTISIVIVMKMLVMMHEWTSSVLGTASCVLPLPPNTTHCGIVQFDGTREAGGHKGMLQSVGISPLGQQPVTEAASLVADDGVQDVCHCPEEAAVWSKSSSLPLSPRNLRSTAKL